MRTIVVGAGVIGLSVAWHLQRAGADVVVLEAGAVGAGASAGNAGWVSPGLSRPVPGPGVIAQAIRWTLRPTSPLLLRPSLDPEFLRWSARFMRACTRARSEAAIPALLDLVEPTHDMYARLAAEGVAFEHHADGLIALTRSPGALRAAAGEFSEMAAAGLGSFTVLDGDRVRELEPAVGPEVIGGILSEHERHVRPETLCAGLHSALAERGAQVRSAARVTALRRAQGGWRVRAGEQELEADAVVLAAGAVTSRLLAELTGVRFLMVPGRGYSATFAGLDLGLRRCLELWELRIACSPFDGGVRFAGTMEIATRTERRAAQRKAAVARSAGDYLAGFDASAHAPVLWEGERPLTSDGLPVIGPVPGHLGLHVATGHAMLGVTLAPATGAALAPVVLGERPADALHAFRVDRPGIRA